jgi:hypothetical protein
LPHIILYNKIIGGELTMIYNIEALRNMYKEYSNINQKISLETKKEI